MFFLLNLFKNLNLCTSYIMNVFSFAQWNKYFHSVKNEMYHSNRLRLVEWNISSFTSWKYLYHCTHKHSLFVYYFHHDLLFPCTIQFFCISKHFSKNVTMISRICYTGTCANLFITVSKRSLGKSKEHVCCKTHFEWKKKKKSPFKNKQGRFGCRLVHMSS